MIRREKIMLLKSILKGKLSIDDLRPKQLKTVIHIGKSGSTEYFINDEKVSKEAFEEAKKGQPKEIGHRVTVKIGGKEISEW